MIKEAFKRLYKGDDALQNHLILFVMTGFAAMLSSVLNMYSTVPLVDNAPLWLLRTLLLLIMVVFVYLYGGYFCLVNHRAYDDSTPELLPNFTREGFKVLFKFLPLILFWGAIGLVIVVAFNVLIAFATTSRGAYITWQLLYKLCFAFYILLLPFVMARFSENFDRKGLYNPLVPMKDLYKSVKEIGLLVFKFIPAGLVLLVFLILGSTYDIVGFLFTALYAYGFALTVCAVNYCYVQVYREKIKKEQ